MAIFIVTLLLQVAFVIHVIKTGRNQLWIWVLIIPGIALVGMLAYLCVEILPELFRSRTAQRTARGLKKAMDPTADLRRYEGESRVAGNVARRSIKPPTSGSERSAWATLACGQPVASDTD